MWQLSIHPTDLALSFPERLFHDKKKQTLFYERIYGRVLGPQEEQKIKTEFENKVEISRMKLT